MPVPVSIADTISVLKQECGLTSVDQIAVRIQDMLVCGGTISALA
jgi:hypothetical protein